MGPGFKNEMDLTGTAEGERVLQMARELGHSTLAPVSAEFVSAPQPMVGAEREPAPQLSVTANHKL